jgi:hypothetical protein
MNDVQISTVTMAAARPMVRGEKRQGRAWADRDMGRLSVACQRQFSGAALAALVWVASD